MTVRTVKSPNLKEAGTEIDYHAYGGTGFPKVAQAITARSQNISRLANDVLEKGVCPNNFGRYRADSFSAAADFAEKFFRQVRSGAKGAPLARA
jgi:hypothetical protein